MGRARLLIFTAVCTALLSGRAGADADWAAREQTVKTALKSKDDLERARAFDPLRQSDEPRAVDLVIWGVDQVVQEQARIRKDQAATEKAYEDALTEQEKNTAWFESSSHSGKDLDRYNAAERKISKARDQALFKLKDLENDFTRTRSQVDNAVIALAAVLGNLGPADLPAALAKVEAAWLRGKRTEDAVLWLDAVGGLDRPAVDAKLREVVRDATVAMSVRVPTLDTLLARKDPVALDVALSFLEKGEDEFPLVRTAIGVLRRLHDRRGVEPLIDYLARPDVKALRDDAREALVSLTGQTHGPYADPWKAWWKDAKATFTMPEKPVDPKKAQADQGGVTFYGIHTFSDRILFVLDVSGSMDQASPPGPDGKPGEARITIALKELAGAVHNLNDGDRFNVILFNHQVLVWQAGKMVESSETSRRQAVRWAEELPPTGGTNIHDALEAAFLTSTRTTGRPEVDTILFMTDGRPTAGKIQKPDQILEQVRLWNRTAKVKIHCVGVGEHDEAFLRTLAEIGGGEYVKR